MSLKRREFLFQGAALAALPSLSSTVSSGAAVESGHQSALSSAYLIWSTQSVPLSLKGGTSVGIASSANGHPKDTTPDLHSVFAKEITLPALPTEAHLHLFAFTRYRLYVNGSYVGRGPCRFQNQRPEYDTRDVRSVLRTGINVFVILVHRDAPGGRIMRHDAGLIASLDLEHSGKRQVIVTDESWLSMPERSFGPRTEAWASIEEHIDARTTGDWMNPNLKLSTWKPSAIVSGSDAIEFYPRSSPLQTEQERSWSQATREYLLELSAGSEVSLSLPEIAQAFAVLEMDAEEGSSLEITYCLPQGQESGKCTYVARSGTQTYMGGDTFAFKRLQLRLRSGHLRLQRVKAFEVRYPFQRAASFECSDPSLNRLWRICARSLEVLSEDAYVDCADRERVEWTDCSPPAFDCTRVMMRGPDEQGRMRWADSRLLAAMLRRVALTQLPDGQLKAHSCSERFDIHAVMEDRTCDWIVLLREYFESSGDAELVRELWPTLARLLDWYRKRRTDRGLIQAREWEVWDNPLRYQFCEGAGLNAMIYRALVDAAALAKSIGKLSESKELTQEGQLLRTSYNRLLWNEQEDAYDGALFGPGSEIRPQLGHAFSGLVAGGRFRATAQANLFALYSGIVPPRRIASVRKWILNHVAEVREPMSHYYLFQMLYAMEDEQQEHSVIQLMKAGWKNQVDSEWQTTWEQLEQGGGSKVHIYGMHPGYFLSAYVLGARREGAARERTILIEPRFSGLDWAKGVCVTEFGPVEMDWKRNETGMSEIDCIVPQAVKAKLRLRAEGKTESIDVNGSTVLTERVGGWHETSLRSGKNKIHF